VVRQQYQRCVDRARHLGEPSSPRARATVAAIDEAARGRGQARRAREPNEQAARSLELRAPCSKRF
jgi:hypothetical protein